MNERKTLQLAQAFALAARGVTGDRIPLARTLSEEVLPASIETAVREEMKEKARKAKKAGLFGSLGQAAGTIGAGLLAPVTGGASLALAAGAGALGGGIGRVAGEAIGGNKDPFDKFGRAALEGGGGALLSGGGQLLGEKMSAAALGANSPLGPRGLAGAQKLQHGIGQALQGAANFQQSPLGQFFQRPEFNALSEAYGQEGGTPELPSMPSTFGMNTQQVQGLAREQQQMAQFQQSQQLDRKKFATQTALQLEGLKQEMKIAKDHAALTKDLATLRETGDDRRLSESFKQDLEKLDKTLTSREKELQSGREFEAGQAELDRKSATERARISAANSGDPNRERNQQFNQYMDELTLAQRVDAANFDDKGTAVNVVKSKYPQFGIITTVTRGPNGEFIGEGGSGGALGIGIGDRVLMLTNAYYSVISPEGCAAILWKDRTKAPEAASALKLTSPDLLKLGIIDEIIPEPLGGAHRDPEWTAAQVKMALKRHLLELIPIPREELPKKRIERLKSIGTFKNVST